MQYLGFFYLGIGVVLGLVTFQLCHSMDWHWSVGVLFGLVPIGLTFFCGIFGLLAGAAFVGGLFKACSKSSK